MSGVWIAFEGGDATGKSTQAVRLATRLEARLTREPGQTWVGAQIRQLLLDPAATGLHPRTEMLLMAADRAEHVADIVRSELGVGRVVVSDRSAYSSLAYQGYGRGLPLEEVRGLCDWATEGLWPSLVVLLDVPDDVRATRLAHKAAIHGADRFEQAGFEFHRRVNEGFRAMAAEDPDRWAVVDGSGTVDEVAARVNAAVDAWMAVHA